MPRLLFEKTGRAVWISHLDLMRLFQRTFKRSGLPLTHTQGFNPRPSVSIALPLSVGVESACELLDFDLDGAAVSCDEICDRLNRALVDGVRVLKVYEDGRKIKELSYLHCQVTMEYDNGIPENILPQINALFAREKLSVPKKSKNGVVDQNISPLIKELNILTEGERLLILDCVIRCQNPALNPMQLAAAVNLYFPEGKADHVKCSRVEIYDETMTVFR